MTNAVVIFSGGVDSTAAALWAIDHNYENIELLTYRFGDERRQYGELGASINVASRLGLAHTIIDHYIPFPAFPLTNQPFCQHVSRKTLPGDEVAIHGVFPLNVALLVLFGASYAAIRGCTDVIWGAIKEEADLTADFTANYSSSLTSIINSSQTIVKEMRAFAPLVDQNKWKIVERFKSHAGLFECTWSCKNSNDNVHCGTCYGCEGRRLAAVLAGIGDNTVYKSGALQHPFDAHQLQSFTSGQADPKLELKLAAFMRGSGRSGSSA